MLDIQRLVGPVCSLGFTLDFSPQELVQGLEREVSALAVVCATVFVQVHRANTRLLLFMTENNLKPYHSLAPPQSRPG